jgi:hypothetical protein
MLAHPALTDDAVEAVFTIILTGVRRRSDVGPLSPASTTSRRPRVAARRTAPPSTTSPFNPGATIMSCTPTAATRSPSSASGEPALAPSGEGYAGTREEIGESASRRAAQVAALVDRVRLLRTALSAMANDLALARREVRQLRRENARLKQRLTDAVVPGSRRR